MRFDFNEYNLASRVQSTLAQYADCIKKGSLRFTLEGHADERGTDEFNMVLSQKRAASVRKYLVDLGVSGGALDTVGYGENKPAVNGSNEDGLGGQPPGRVQEALSSGARSGAGEEVARPHEAAKARQNTRGAGRAAGPRSPSSPPGAGRSPTPSC